jgi:hypothetical protein
MDIDVAPPSSPRPGPRPSGSLRQPLLACLATMVAAALALGAVALGTAIEQAANPPTCYGIGWGCTPDAGTTALLLGWFVAAPAVAIAWILTWVGWAVTRHRTERARRIATWWPTGVLAVAALVIALLAVTTAG